MQKKDQSFTTIALSLEAIAKKVLFTTTRTTNGIIKLSYFLD